MKDHKDELRRIYSHLCQIQKSDLAYVGEGTVMRYHELLDRLITLDYDVTEFKLNANDYVEMGSRKTNTGQLISSNPQVIPLHLRQKLNALMMYFDLSEEAKIVEMNAPRIRE